MFKYISTCTHNHTKLCSCFRTDCIWLGLCSCHRSCELCRKTFKWTAWEHFQLLFCYTELTFASRKFVARFHFFVCYMAGTMVDGHRHLLISRICPHPQCILLLSKTQMKWMTNFINPSGQLYSGSVFNYKGYKNKDRASASNKIRIRQVVHQKTKNNLTSRSFWRHTYIITQTCTHTQLTIHLSLSSWSEESTNNFKCLLLL